MNLSFYSAAVGASAQQTRLDIIANNISNINTAGYKAKSPRFNDLLYANIREPEENVSKIRQGSGAGVFSTTTRMDRSSYDMTEGLYDYVIVGDGLFALQNPATEEIFYTRAGSFQLSQRADGEFYLVSPKGDLVLDPDFNSIMIPVNSYAEGETELVTTAEGEEVAVDNSELNIGIFNFANREGFLSVGATMFSPVPKNGEPFLDEYATLQRGCVETSNVEIAQEMTDMIAAQRLYQINLRMVQTSDEIEGTINSLRG